MGNIPCQEDCLCKNPKAEMSGATWRHKEKACVVGALRAVGAIGPHMSEIHKLQHNPTREILLFSLKS